MRRILYLLFFIAVVASAQNPQAPAGSPLFHANATYTNGIAPGYYPTAGSGLVLNIGPGTADCSGTIETYTGGTLTLTASATNYMYLNTASSCAPASKTTAFVAADIPIAVIVTSGTAITSIIDDRTPFVFTTPPSSLSLTTNGANGPASLAGNVLNVPDYSSGNGGGSLGCFLGSGGLVGVFTNGSGVIQAQPLCIGGGQVNLSTPAGATQLQLGIVDNKYVDDTGSFSVDIQKNGGTASPVSVLGTSMPWSISANPSYSYGQNDGTSAIVAITGLTPTVDIVTVTYVSGTVNVDPGGGAPNVNANGWLTSPIGPACTGGPVGVANCGSFGVAPTYYMAGPAAITALTGDVTATGPGSVAATLATVNSGPGACGDSTHVCQVTTNAKGLVTAQTPVSISSGGEGSPGGSNGNLQYNNSGSFGGDADTNDDGSGNITVKTAKSNSTGAGVFEADAGTAQAGVPGAALYTTDPTNGYAEVNENDTGNSRVCTATNGVCSSGGATPALVGPLETHTASTSATLDFTTCFSSTYDKYLFEFTNISVDTDTANVQWLASTDGGSTWQSTNYYSVTQETVGGSGGITRLSNYNTSTGSIVRDVRTVAPILPISGSIKFYDPLNASINKQAVIEGLDYLCGSNGDLCTMTGSTTWTTTTAMNAVRFEPSTGNFASGTIACYGITH